MYGQGSYNSQPRQGPHTPMLPPYPPPQQLPGPPPPPHFLQGPPAPPPSVGGPPMYQHGRPVPPPPPPPAAILNTSQSYWHPQSTVLGSTPLPHIYSTDHHSKQFPSHLGPQNVHMPPSVLPNPPRGLPPPAPTMYRGPMHLPSQHPGGGQDLQCIPPPHLPPSSSSFFTNTPLGSFVQSTGGNSHVSSFAPLPPPPPPLSPPPIPPSPPPPTSPLFMSSMHRQSDSNLTIYNEPSSFKLSTSGSVPKVATTNEARQNIPLGDGYLNEEGSFVGGSLSSRVSVISNLPPPPPKPIDKKIVQKIEDLCELIAKNGPRYEDMIRQNESGNPEYSFLFTGDPGSEATIAHEYFLWMKKKHSLASKLNEEKSDSHLRPLVPSSMQTDNLVVAATSSPADSDMEMEDDITQSVNEKVGNHSTECTNSDYDLIQNELGINEQLHMQQISASEKSVSPLPLEKGASENIVPEESSTQLIKSDSPFRLLQDYTSDDEYASRLKDSSSLAATSLHRGTGSNLEMDTGSRNPGKAGKDFGLQSGLTLSDNAGRFPERGEVKETATGSFACGTADEHVDGNQDKQASISHAESPQAFQKKDTSGGACIEVSLNGKFQKEIEDRSAKSASNSLKVDKFGRLVREGASDSDSDDSHSNGRQNKRGRSRSRSPIDRQRRSPRWRREKRSRSRSWSPQNCRSMSRSPRYRRSRSRSPRYRRSRSRSPAFKHSREFGGENMRRDRGQVPDCFDFRRGRCYRGASCRYLHHDSEKGDGSKLHSSRQYFEVPHFRENSNIHVDIKHNITNVFDKEHNEVNISEMQQLRNVPAGTSVATKDGNTNQKKEDSIGDAPHSASFHQNDQLIDCHTVKSGSSKEAAKAFGTQGLRGEKEVPITLCDRNCQGAMESQRPILVGGFPPHPVRDLDTLKSLGEASQIVLSVETSLIKQSLSNLSDPVLQNPDCPPLRTDNSSLSDSAPEPTSMTSVNKIPVTEGLPNRHHSPQLPPSPPLSRCVTIQPMTQPPQDNNLTPKDAAFPLQSDSREQFPSYMLPNQPSHFSVSPIASRSLPPPPPGLSSQLQQSCLAPKVISRLYTAELPIHSEVGDFQQQVYPLQEPHRSLLHAEDFRLKPLPLNNSQSQKSIGSSLSREDHMTQLPEMAMTGCSSCSQGDNQPVPTAFSWELSVNRMQPFQGDNLPPGELLKSSFQVHPYLQQQKPPHGLHHPVAVSSSPKYPPDLQETNQSSRLPDFRGSANSTYHNAYASSAEQPLSSKFSSEALRPEAASHSSQYAAPFSLSHAQIDRQNIGTAGSGWATSSQNSAKAIRQNFPRSGGDQYDPLLDSLEPSTNLSNKFGNAQRCEPSSDSDIMLRHSGSNKPLDVEENNKKKEVGGVAVATSVDDEEYGETADAEVGYVENGSPTNHAVNMPTGEIEIDQIKSPGKSKKNKESRSMKLFKVALADFVKEVLKPSWRQGNMSKEAFKTIVKKTVDKVSGAMRSHQIPKSRAKINQYIDSQQRKLTKLVTGYVDKYVKI